MSEELFFVVVCAKQTDPLKPGFLGGFKCSNCGQAIQLSPSAQQQRLCKNMRLFCNSCGLALRDEAIKRNMLAGTAFNPEFIEQFRQLWHERKL